MTFKLYTDGGARGNPGPGGIGVVLQDAKNETVYELAKYIGKCTNNEAEYLGVLHGLQAAKSKDVKKLEVIVDSELVVKQLTGDYKVKNDRLKKLYMQVKELESSFVSISYKHVKRDKNKRADALVNEALDQNGF